MKADPPRASIVPVVWVTDESAAIDWYTRVFDFVSNAAVRADLSLPDGGALRVGQVHPGPRAPRDAGRPPEILLKVEDAAATVSRAVGSGATIIYEARDIEAGERQATFDDVFGHRWLVTQTLVDKAPEQWGGRTMAPRM